MQHLPLQHHVGRAILRRLRKARPESQFSIMPVSGGLVYIREIHTGTVDGELVPLHKTTIHGKDPGRHQRQSTPFVPTHRPRVLVPSASA